MEKTREAFLKALQANEDDIDTRLVYADWLEERGEDKEAGRQRAWLGAKAWLIRLCARKGGGSLSYRELMNVARKAAEEASTVAGHFAFPCPGDPLAQNWSLSIDKMPPFDEVEALCDRIEQNKREFWRNVSIVTGIPLPPDIEDRVEIVSFMD